jgi:3-phenylpropionate/trans-cinnamate dioxygenase ferredoxin subunit
VPFYRVARTEEIPPNQTRYYCVEGRPLVIAHRDGRFFALDGICPHRGNPLDGAILWGDLIDCPWHHFQYDIRTGENVYPKNVYPEDVPELQKQLGSLPVYQVELRGSEIWVQLE